MIGLGISLTEFEKERRRGGLERAADGSMAQREGGQPVQSKSLSGDRASRINSFNPHRHPGRQMLLQ